MPLDGWLLLEKIHGHLALLAIAASCHPSLTLRGERLVTWRQRLSGYLATLLTVAAFASGCLIYSEFRRAVRPELRAVGEIWFQLFEIKEHLAWTAFCLSLIGGIGLLRTQATAPAAILRNAYRLSAILALVVAAIGIVTASIRSF